MTGVDWSPQMVEACRRNAESAHVQITLLTSDLAEKELNLPEFDCIVGLNAFYSLVPGRERRIRLLRNLRRVLTPEGVIVLGYHRGKCDPSHRPMWSVLYRRRYEEGDIFYGRAPSPVQ